MPQTLMYHINNGLPRILKNKCCLNPKLDDMFKGHLLNVGYTNKTRIEQDKKKKTDLYLEAKNVHVCIKCIFSVGCSLKVRIKSSRVSVIQVK